MTEDGYTFTCLGYRPANSGVDCPVNRTHCRPMSDWAVGECVRGHLSQQWVEASDGHMRQ